VEGLKEVEKVVVSCVVHSGRSLYSGRRSSWLFRHLRQKGQLSQARHQAWQGPEAYGQSQYTPPAFTSANDLGPHFSQNFLDLSSNVAENFDYMTVFVAGQLELKLSSNATERRMRNA